MPTRAGPFGALVACVVLVSPAHHAAADEADVCATAGESAEHLRAAGKLRQAREQLLTCVRPSCPFAVKAFCDRWLSEIDAELPTVVLGAQDTGGADLTTVQVTLDGAPFVDQLDGKPLAVDPGVRTFRFRHQGDPPIEQTLVIRASEKNRVISVRFTQAARAPLEASPHGERPSPPILAYVLLGASAVSLGAFVFFDISGQSRFSDCRQNGCSQSTVDGIDLSRGLAYATLGAGLVTAGLGTWLLLSRPTRATAAAQAGVALTPAPGGGVARFQALF